MLGREITQLLCSADYVADLRVETPDRCRQCMVSATTDRPALPSLRYGTSVIGMKFNKYCKVLCIRMTSPDRYPEYLLLQVFKTALLIVRE